MGEYREAGFPLPLDEDDRLAALRGLRVLDTGPEERFDRITRLAQRVFGVPIALVSLVDEDRQWSKSCQGLLVTETARDVSFCTYTILGDEPLVVRDARLDPRFAENPLVTDDPGVRFYAGQAIHDRFGYRLGSLCVMDRQPREFSGNQLEMLTDLAGWAEEELKGGGEHYVNLFAEAPVALWEEDFTQVEAWLNDVRTGGVADLRSYLTSEPCELDTAIGLIRVTDVNRAAAVLLEADSRERLLGGFTTETMTDSLRRAFLEQFVAICEQRHSVEARFTGVTIPGNRIDCLLRWSAPVVGGSRDLSRVTVAITDLTDSARAEEAIRQSEERFRTLFDTAADAIIAMDGEKRISLFNEQAEVVFGYRAEEIIGEPLVTLLPSRFRDAHPQQVESFAHDAVSRRPMSAREVMQGLRKNGEQFPIEVTIAKRPVNGQFEFTAVVRDVTEREEARKALDALMRSKDELIASISHELRTPLTAVMGFAHLLQQDASTFSGEERAEMVRSIVEEGMDLANIVDDLLVAAQAETRSLAVVSVVVDLRAQLAQVLETVNLEKAEHIELSGRTVRATGDPARVRQILRNLISNALRYGGDKVRVSVDSADSTARVAVIDDGPAIPAQDRELIFEPYQRAHDAPGRTAAMGLGLTVSRELARLMGGDLTYRHEADESVFELSLPRTE